MGKGGPPIAFTASYNGVERMQVTEQFARKSRPQDFEARDLTILAGLAEGLTNREICDSAQLPRQ